MNNTKQLTLDDYQVEAGVTAMERTVEHMAFGLLEEAGEVAGILKRVYRKDPQYYVRPDDGNIYAYYAPVSPEAREKLSKELGDVLWYVAMLAEVLDITLSYVAVKNIKKLRERQSAKTIIGSGDDR